MSVEQYANNFSVTLTDSVNDSTTTFPVNTAAPAALQGGQFRMIFDNEIVLVTGGQSGTSWTVTRGVESPGSNASHGSGTTGTHVLTKDSLLNSNWIDIRSKGAVLDGTTADTIAWTDMATALMTAGGGGVFVPDGMSILGATVTIAASDVVIQGASWNAEIKAATSWVTTNQPMFNVTGARVIFENLTLNGNRSGRGSVSTAHTVRVTGNDITFRNCRITGDVWEAIRCNTGSTITRLTVVDCLFDDGYGGYVVLANPTRCTISRNRMLANVSDSPINIKASNATGNEISDNLIVDAADVAINLGAATGAVRTVLTGNRIINPVNHGINLAAATDGLVSNNLIVDAGATGILAGARTVITGNRIIAAGDTVAASNPDGIYAADDCTITGNIIQNSGRSGVRVDGSTRVVVAGNAISGSGAISTGREINVRNAATYVTVANNTLGGGGANLDVGILVEGAGTDYVSVTDNTVGGYATPISKAGTAGHNVRISGNLGFNPQGAAAISMTASPFTYTNTDGVSEAVYIRGGTISDVSKNSRTIFTATGCTVWLEPNESVVVTYSSAPTIEKDRK
jgi:parallel beta-helix repeat protein